MKRYFLLILALVMMLTACAPATSNGGASSPSTDPSTDPSDPPASDPPASDPPATEPPATEPPATEPPVTKPPQTEPPVTEPVYTAPAERSGCSVPTAAKEAILTYKSIGGKNLRVYFRPATNHVYGKDPVIYIIPGGGYMDANLNGAYAIYSAEASEIRAAGFAIATIEYRTGRDAGVTIEEIFSDIADGMRYLTYYADVLNIDPQKFITTGHSAGGGAALLMGYAPHALFDEDKYWTDAGDFGVAGVYSLSGNTIFYKDADGPWGGYYSSGSKNTTNLWVNDQVRQLCSPINYVKAGGVPCKILMGEMDELVSPIGITKFKNACDAAGVSCEVVWFANAGHGFNSMNGQAVSPDYNVERKKIIQFAQACVQ